MSDPAYEQEQIMSFYVRRTRIADGRVGWVGPIRSERRALREADAWNISTARTPAEWTAVVLPSTPKLRAEVRAWGKANAS